MIICVCHRVSDRDIRSAVRSGCLDFDKLQEELRVGTGCGACLECAHDEFHAQAAACAGRGACRSMALAEAAA
jgi:bacterioferritin-associated ferredoxin